MRWSFVLIVVIWFIAHALLGRYLISNAKLGVRTKRVVWFALASLALLTPVGQVLLRQGGLPSRTLATVVYLSLGLSSLLIAFMIAFGVSRLTYRLARQVYAFAFVRAGEEPDEHADPQRRAFFGRAARMTLLGGSGALVAGGYVIARRTPPVREVVIDVPGLPAAFDG